MIIANALNSTSRIWSVFSDNTGVLSDVGTAQVDIYPMNSDTPILSNGTMTRFGTGVYFYSFNVGTVGEYTANFNFNLTGTIFSNNEPISVNANSINGNFEKASGTIGRIWANYSSSSGERVDAGTMSVTIYPSDNNTPSVASSVMTRLGTGLYYYPFNYGTFANGNYTAIFNALNGTLNYGGMQSFLVTVGTYAVGVPPTRIGTIAFENGTSGTSAYLKWTPEITATGYDIYRADRPFDNFIKVSSVANTVGTYFDTTVKNQNEYWYEVIGTNSGGASLPSPIVTGFVYDSAFNNFNNTMQTIKTQMQLNATWINNIYIGQELVFPNQLPVVQLIPNTNEDINVSLGFTGKKDEVYNISVRTYYSDVATDSAESIANVSIYVGKLLQLFETLKQYSPYWYNSQINDIIYGENVINNKQLKYVDILWQGKRRVTR